MRASFLDQGRFDGRQLFARVRMWVHCCASINADVCAFVPFKLYAMGGTTSKAIVARGWGRPLIAREKAHVIGRTDCVLAMTAKGAVYDIENMTVIERHPLLGVLQDVNPYSSGFDWRVGIYYDLDIFGSAYTHLLQAGGRPMALWRMLPHITQVMLSRENFIEGFEYGETTDRQMFVPDEVLWFKLFDPQNPYGGLSLL
jgi:hypothetical protein